MILSFHSQWTCNIRQSETTWQSNCHWTAVLCNLKFNMRFYCVNVVFLWCIPSSSWPSLASKYLVLPHFVLCLKVLCLLVLHWIVLSHLALLLVRPFTTLSSYCLGLPYLVILYIVLSRFHTLPHSPISFLSSYCFGLLILALFHFVDYFFVLWYFVLFVFWPFTT